MQGNIKERKNQVPEKGELGSKYQIITKTIEAATKVDVYYNCKIN